MSADEGRIRSLWESMAARWAAGDADGFAAHFSDDCDFTNVRGRKPGGRAGIAAGHDHLFRTDYRGTTLAARVGGVRFLGADAAVVNAESTITARDGTALATTHALAVVERRTTDDEWVVTAFHNMLLSQPSPQPSPQS